MTAYQTYYRCQAYLEYNTVVEYTRTYPNQLDFPAVTFCNFNKYDTDYILVLYFLQWLVVKCDLIFSQS